MSNANKIDDRQYEYRTLLHRIHQDGTDAAPIYLAPHDGEDISTQSFLYNKYRMWDVETLRREVGKWDLIDKRIVTDSGGFVDWPKDSEIIIPDKSYEYTIDFDNPLSGRKLLNDGSLSDHDPRRLYSINMYITDDIYQAYMWCNSACKIDGARWVKLFRRSVGEWKSWRRSGLPPNGMDVEKVREEWERLLGAWQ